VNLNEILKEIGKCLICWFFGGLFYMLFTTKAGLNGSVDPFQALVDGWIISSLIILLYMTVRFVIYKFYKPIEE